MVDAKLGNLSLIEATGAAQYMRDARVTAIYEGTNGIQAIDLVQRKLGLSGGATVAREIAEMRGVVALSLAAPSTGPLERVEEKCEAVFRPQPTPTLSDRSRL